MAVELERQSELFDCMIAGAQCFFAMAAEIVIGVLQMISCPFQGVKSLVDFRVMFVLIRIGTEG